MSSAAVIASLDVDAQQGFSPLCPNELPVPEGDKIVTSLNAQAEYATIRIGSKDAHPVNPIWLANDKHPPFSELNAKNADMHWPSHCVPGTPGFDLLPGLPHPSDYDFFVWKGIEPDMHPYGACYHDLDEQLSTGLIEYLRAKGVDKIIVGGLATDYCVKTTVLQLCRAQFSVMVHLPACRGIDEHTTEQALRAMKKAGALMAESTDDLEHKLGG